MSDAPPPGLLDVLAHKPVLNAIIRLLDPAADDASGLLLPRHRFFVPLSTSTRALRSAVLAAVSALQLSYRRSYTWLHHPLWVERFTGVRRLEFVGGEWSGGMVCAVLEAFRERAGVVPKVLRLEQGNVLAGAQPTQLLLPPNLEGLSLNNPSPQVLGQIAQLTLLETLKLSVKDAAALTEATASIPCLSRLTSLEIDGAYRFTRSPSADVAWRAALQAVSALPQLRELTMDVKTHERLGGPLALPGGALTSLRKLSISSKCGDSAGLGPDVLHGLLAAATGLTSLGYHGVEGSTLDAQHMDAMCRMTALQVLRLTGTDNPSGAPAITPALLLRLPTLRSLRTLLLRPGSKDRSSLTDARLLEMAVSMPALEELTLISCPLMTDAIIWGLLMATTPKLRLLRIYHNPRISFAASAKMQQLAEARGLELDMGTMNGAALNWYDNDDDVEVDDDDDDDDDSDAAAAAADDDDAH